MCGGSIRWLHSAVVFQTTIDKLGSSPHFLGQWLTVRRQQKDCLLFALDLKHQFGNLIGRLAIEISCWLVSQQELGSHYQTTRQGSALPFTPGTFSRMVLFAVGKTYPIE